MRARLAAGGALGALAGAIACGVITLPPDPTVPVNACTDNTSCAKSFPDASVSPQCFGGACVGATPFHPILVVSVPQNPPSTVAGLGGTTFGLPDTYETERGKSQPTACRLDVECDYLPSLLQVQNGHLDVSQGLGRALWPPNGLRPAQNDPVSESRNTSLPVHAKFHPMWVDPASGNLYEATKLGLPLDDIEASIGTSNLFTAPTTSSSQKDGVVFDAYLPQPLATDSSGAYLLEVVPNDPFAVFPPYVSRPVPADKVATADPRYLPLTVPPGDVTKIPVEDVLNGNPTPSVYAYPFEIDEASNGPTMTGWTAYIVNSDGRRTSGNVTLPAGATKNIILYEGTGTADQSGETLFVDPPPGTDLPRMIVRATGTSIAPPTTLPYPQLPAAVQVCGFVARSDAPATNVSATIVFYANGQELSTNPPVLVEADGTTPASTLAYKKTTATTSLGEYAAMLRPGTLRVYVIPDDPSLALTVGTQQVSSSDGTQCGKTLSVNPRAHVRGRVRLPDGTPVFAADVVIDPSADDPLAPATDPDSDPLQRPREARGSTDANGDFDILSDPGLVDISIRPHDGTQLPWAVVTNAVVPIEIPSDGGTPAGLTIPDVEIQLPTPFASTPLGVLTDPTGGALPDTLVRAYAFPPSPPAGDGGVAATRAARLIGTTVTDSSGLFQLFVAPPQ